MTALTVNDIKVKVTPRYNQTVQKRFPYLTKWFGGQANNLDPTPSAAATFKFLNLILNSDSITNHNKSESERRC